MGCRQLLIQILAFFQLHLLTQGQSSISALSSNDSDVHRELAEQLIEIHREIIRMQVAINDSQRNSYNAPGGLQSLTQQVNRMLLYALPGVLGRTVGMVQDGNFAYLGAEGDSNEASDYKLSEILKQAIKQASRTVKYMQSTFFKSLETLQVMSLNLMPTIKYQAESPSYKGCHDAFLKGERTPGVYSILRDRQLQFRAWCDFDESGGWTIIQRRFDGTVNFGRPLEQYVNGFGSLWGEYWLGLRTMHLLTQGTVRLSIYLEDSDGNRYTQSYSSFAVGDSYVYYRLHVAGFTAGPNEFLYYNNGSYFSTWDQDRDGSSTNCAQSSSGGWWFNSCTQFNPNGRYDDGPESSEMFMHAYIGGRVRLAAVAMRINV